MADTAGPDPDLGPGLPQFPNSRRRPSGSAVPPSTSSRRPSTSDPTPNPSSDVDTCRICRGEGTPHEPLFYPCKCSGSIKYVHQDCLMEWLSHSQKKHCELCKTPFRFTKLYAPNMPKALPFHIFISHVAQYLLRNMLVWLRAALVVSVWLGWLPYLMRSVWSFLFWISDEGFSRNTSLFGSHNGRIHNGTSFISALTSWDNAGTSLDSIPRIVRALYAINITKSDRPYAAFLRLVFGGIGAKDNAGLLRSSAFSDMGPSGPPTPPSLLSEVGFLRNLTRHPRVNRVIIATLEGQIITILVVVCFILIILVRDYVVQQQPDINIRAAFAAGDDELPAQQPEDPPRNEHNDDPPHPDPGAEDAVIDAENGHFDGNHEDDEPLGQPAQARVRHGSGESTARLEADDVASRNSAHSSGFQVQDDWFYKPGARGTSHADQLELSGPSQTPMDFSEDEETAVRQFMRIYRQAEGDPERILELAKEQQLQDKLDWWMKMTRSKIDRHDGLAQSKDEDFSASADGESSAQDRVLTANSAGEEGCTDQDEEVHPSLDKGKARAEDDDSELVPLYQFENAVRPRAYTDGPKVSTTVNPLANNNWSFADLPSSDHNAELRDEVPGFQGSSDSTHLTPSSSSGVAEATSTGSAQLPSSLPATPDIDFADARPDAGQGTTQPDDPSFNFNTHPGLDVRVQRRRQPAGVLGRVADFMWGDVEAIDPAELVPLHVPDELHVNEAAPFLDDAQEADILIGDERDREVVEAAVAAGIDPDAIEDAEDLEGILELLGMRGPIAGLFQNAIFCAFLVAVTLLLGVFLPYNLGRITVWTVANPMRLVRILFSISKFLQDVAVICFGFVVGAASYAFVGWWKLLSRDTMPRFIDAAVDTSWNMSLNAATRVLQSFTTEMPILSASEMRNFSALSHDALLSVKAYISMAFWAIGHGLELVFGGSHHANISDAISWTTYLGGVAWKTFKEMPHTLSDPSSWVINLSLPESTDLVNPELAYWGGTDRFWAILCGYTAFSIFAALYLRRGVPFSSGPTGQELETSLLDVLKQASGVMKVILIIGIEMLVFPLYCGLLLDVALLPLFENTTVKSRLLFTYNYPLTSIFVHWFVGTGYMFHFALFVSMCRKIMRKGVLYFIRDPDDPEFHPVRDVLERNVTTQLRKILFSAFVYGALVIICLGGVVWGLSYSIPNVLPIHYSSNEPVLEFPIDLLFYNFLMPLAVRFFKPSDALHAMYTWWFRECARALRLTWFLFGERRVDEEGVLVLAKDSPYRKLPWWRKLFLEVGKDYEVVPKTWKHVFEGGKAKPTASIPDDEMFRMDILKLTLKASGQIIPDGRFVRTPASDQVKIPKGKAVFLEVAENNKRQDGKPDDAETDIYSTHQYQLVYIPPFFRVRVFLFILFIWGFAAFTGVGITIVPLVFGRSMFKLFIPAHIRTNDIYAFSIGIYILGSLTYSISHARSILGKARSWLAVVVESVTSRDAVQRAISMAVKASQLLYAYFFLLVVFPIMVISLMELYLLIPLNTWKYSAVFSTPVLPAVDAVSGPGVVAAATVVNINPRHTIRVIQSWTIGLLYLKLGARVISTWYEDTRLSAAVRAVLRHGWLDPDVTVLTRAFVIPGLVIWAVLVSVPLLVGRTLVARGATESIIAAVAGGLPAHPGMVIDLDHGLHTGDANLIRTDQLDQQLASAVTVLVYRLSFPLTALAVATAAAGWNLINVFRGWKIQIRDEAYLIGERLHNFGGGNGHARTRGPWRAGGPRL